jgi:hypothetical protein
MDIIFCRPENEDAVRDLVKEAGMDIRIVIDPEARGVYSMPNRLLLESYYPELAEQLPERPPQVVEELQESQTTPRAGKPRVAAASTTENHSEVRIVLHHPERLQTVRIETGPVGTEVHLGEYTAWKPGTVPTILRKLAGSKSQPLATFPRLVCSDVRRRGNRGSQNGGRLPFL